MNGYWPKGQYPPNGSAEPWNRCRRGVDSRISIWLRFRFR